MGAIAWVVDFAIFIALYPVTGIVGAQTLARIAGALVSFTGHKVFVFDDRQFSQGKVWRQAFQYSLLWLFSYALSVGCILFFVDFFMLHPVASKLITEVIIIIINFVTMRRFIFSS
ncbi:MAG: GtrA family protein [Candidatus Thiodiazotropha sp. (ex Codakia rugifera)]|nr:GtrA family protein [Candidatus Thiodiazotropha sp. (ex Codakia rugifera)]